MANTRTTNYLYKSKYFKPFLYMYSYGGNPDRFKKVSKRRVKAWMKHIDSKYRLAWW